MARKTLTRKLVENRLRFASENIGLLYLIAWNGQKGQVITDKGHNVTGELSKENLLIWIDGFHKGAMVALQNFGHKPAPIHG